MNDTKKAYIATLIQVAIIGFSFMFVKVALEYVSPLVLLSYRFFFALLASLLPIIVKKVSVDIKVSDILKILPLSLFYPVLFFGFQSFGLLYSSSTEAGIIIATAPIFTAILSNIFLKEKTTKVQNLFICFSMSGIIYISVVNSMQIEGFSIFGTILLILSTVSMAFYNIMSRKLSETYSHYTLTFIMTLIGFIIFTVLSIGNYAIDPKAISITEPLTSAKFLFAIVYLGVFSSFVSSLLTNYALSKLEASKVSVFSNLTPIITLLVGVFILSEEINYKHLIGIAVTIIGVLGTNLFGRKKKKNV
ncbi:MAG: hypothetical protein PEPC_00697 [Peptostreptococcus russellii]